MQTDVKQVFYFHADANSIGGFLEEPYRVIPTPCSVALSPTGGSVTDSEKEFTAEEGIKVKFAYTHVSGKRLALNGPWIQRVVSVVEGLELLGRVSADLVAQMFIEQPAKGGGPRRISFAGSKITNLVIDKKAVTPVFNSRLLPHHHRDVDAYNQKILFKPEMKWPSLRGYAYTQGLDLLNRVDLPDWMQDRFGWIETDPCAGVTEGSIQCSLVDQLVDQIDGLPTGHSYAHCIELPDFGRIFLAEVTVLPYAAHLTMLRAELGCNTTGQFSGASVAVNGTTMPPSKSGG
jgi:hypothetical protein